ncbi:2601_t:CDS:2, partial [Paraglomus brasilianum]
MKNLNAEKEAKARAQIKAATEEQEENVAEFETEEALIDIRRLKRRG